MNSVWEYVLISPEQSIREALRIIDEQGLRVAIVVDSERRLLGIVTDGDIRRGILNEISVDAAVKNIMNSQPRVAKVGTKKEELLKQMEQLNILSMPLVDDDFCIVDLFLFQDLHEEVIYENPVFIMAGGFGTRLRPLTDNCPKPMLKVGERPILEITIRYLKKLGFRNFYISTHYLPEVIHNHFGDGSEYGVSISYVHEEEPLGTGGALSLLPDDLVDLPLIMINGDVLTTIEFTKLLEFHVSNEDSVATICVRDYEFQIPFGVIEGEGNIITSMREKPMHRFFINAGIYVIEQELIRAAIKGKYIDMPTLISRHMNNGNVVNKFPIHEYWLDIGRMEDFAKAQSDINSLGLY